MKSSDTIRWGIIGCGAVTEVKSGPAYQNTPGFELAAVMRRDLSLAKDYAQRHQVLSYSNDANDIIFNNDIDAIYIATPPDSHKHYALLVAEAGKPCCIEKPLAPSYQECLSITQAFSAKKLPLFVAYYRRSLPRFTKVKSLLEQGAIGEIRHISWHLSKPANALDLSGEYNWRTDKAIALGGYFDDLASHGLDLFAFLLGDFQKVSGVAANQQGYYSAFDAVSACWLHANGITGVGSWNFGASSRQDKVTIYGSAGEITFSVFDEVAITLTTHDVRQGTHQASAKIITEEIFIENPEHIQRFHVENISRHLVHNEQHPSTGETALHTSWVMDEILTQS